MDYSKLPLDQRNLERIIATYPGEAVITKERCQIKDETLIDKGVFSKIPAALKDGRIVDSVDNNFIKLNQTNLNPMSKKVGFGLFGFSVFFYLIGGGMDSSSRRYYPICIYSNIRLHHPQRQIHRLSPSQWNIGTSRGVLR